MINAETQLSRGDRERVRDRITELEAQTDAEVVCAIATESGRYDRAESLCGLIVGVCCLIVAQKFAALDDWDVREGLHLGWQVFLVVGGFVVGSLAASYWHALRRLLVSQAEAEQEVHRAVHQVFSRFGIGSTRHRGGILIYVSLFEHRLEILADRTAAEVITAEELAEMRDVALEKIRSGDFAEGLVQALSLAQEKLAVALPHTADQESLDNELLVFHPRP